MTITRDDLLKVRRALIGWCGSFPDREDHEALAVIDAALSAKQAEPVAVVIPGGDTAYGMVKWNADKVPPGTKLYTAPPKRQPLSVKQAETIIYEHTRLNPNLCDDRELVGYIVNAIRAVEREHNIQDPE